MTRELSLLDSLFDDVLAGTYNTPATFHVPAVDVEEKDTAYELTMDLPGRTESDINIELEHGTLVISSKKEITEESKENKAAPKAKFLVKERRISDFCRRFALPENINAEAISAAFKNGVLSVTLPKQEVTAPRKIAIQVA